MTVTDTGMRSYRMTRGEFERLVMENDPLCPEFAGIPAKHAELVLANAGHKINLGYAGVTYDAGFFWVRTSRPVEWM